MCGANLLAYCNFNLYIKSIIFFYGSFVHDFALIICIPFAGQFYLMSPWFSRTYIC
jgi:hypothetical protein